MQHSPAILRNIYYVEHGQSIDRLAQTLIELGLGAAELEALARTNTSPWVPLAQRLATERAQRAQAPPAGAAGTARNSLIGTGGGTVRITPQNERIRLAPPASSAGAAGDPSAPAGRNPTSAAGSPLPVAFSAAGPGTSPSSRVTLVSSPSASFRPPTFSSHPQSAPAVAASPASPLRPAGQPVATTTGAAGSSSPTATLWLHWERLQAILNANPQIEAALPPAALRSLDEHLQTLLLAAERLSPTPTPGGAAQAVVPAAPSGVSATRAESPRLSLPGAW